MDKPLFNSLSHANAILGMAKSGFSLPLARIQSADSLFIDLPEYGGASANLITADTLRVLASLYFVAELEGTHLISVGEELTRSRFTLNITSRDAAQKLESAAQAMERGWANHTLRNQIFARVFGIGFVDSNVGDRAVNHEFEPRFARFCSVIVQIARDMAIAGGYPSGVVTRSSMIIQSLLVNIASKIQGNTLIITDRLTKQLEMMIEVLNHPDMAALFRGRSLWDVIRSVLGPETPDLRAHVTRAQTGLRLLSWMASNMETLRGRNSEAIARAISDEPNLSVWAQMWLQASGVRPMAGEMGGTVQGERLQ